AVRAGIAAVGSDLASHDRTRRLGYARERRSGSVWSGYRSLFSHPRVHLETDGIASGPEQISDRSGITPEFKPGRAPDDWPTIGAQPRLHLFDQLRVRAGSDGPDGVHTHEQVFRNRIIYARRSFDARGEQRQRFHDRIPRAQAIFTGLRID